MLCQASCDRALSHSGVKVIHAQLLGYVYTCSARVTDMYTCTCMFEVLVIILD